MVMIQFSALLNQTPAYAAPSKKATIAREDACIELLEEVFAQNNPLKNDFLTVYPEKLTADQKAAKTLLISLGYDSSVAHRIAIEKPKWLTKLESEKAGKAYRPARVFRGFRGKIEDFRPDFVNKKERGDDRVWISASRKSPGGYAVRMNWGDPEIDNDAVIAAIDEVNKTRTVFESGYLIEYELPGAVLTAQQGEATDLRYRGPPPPGVDAWGWYARRTIPNDSPYILNIYVIDGPVHSVDPRGTDTIVRFKVFSYANFLSGGPSKRTYRYRLPFE